MHPPGPEWAESVGSAAQPPAGQDGGSSSKERAEPWAVEELRRRDAVLEAVAFAAEQFLASADWEQAVQPVLQRLGTAARVSRVYVFQNHLGPDAQLLASQRHEWVAPGVASQAGNPHLTAFPWLAAGFGRWVEQLSDGGLIIGHVRDFPPDEQQVLARQSILSILVVPVLVEGHWWGFIGFDACESEREWSVAEAEALKLAARTLAGAVQRRGADDARLQLAREQEFRTLAENAPDLIARFDRDLRHLYVNPVVEEITGLPSSDFIGKTNRELGMPEELVGLWEQEIGRIFQSGREKVVEFGFPTARGRRYFQSRIVPEFGRDGSVQSVLGITRDVTASKEAERTLAFLSEASSVLAGSLDYETTLATVARLAVPLMADWCVVDILGADGRLQRVEVAYAHPTNAGLAQQLRGYYPSGPASPLQTALRTGQPVHLAEVSDALLEQIAGSPEYLRLLREMHPVSALVVPLLAGKRVLGSMSFVAAESERRYQASDLALAQELARRCAQAVENARLYAEAQQAIRLRDEFLSVAAHELKTPMTSLRGFTQLLLRLLDRGEPIEPDRLQRGLRTIDEQTDKLARLTNQLLDVSRLEAGMLVLERQPTDLAPLVTGVVEAMREHTSRHELVVRVPEELPAVVDPLRLEQVLANLLDNAAKFSPEGGVIQVTLRRADTGEAEIAVQDHGIGVPQAHLQSIFDRFQQAHRERHFGGMGLGLYISKQIVELHHGRIWVDSQEGVGTTATVRLPLGLS